MSSYDVAIFKIEERKGKDPKNGKPRSTYRVRWRVGSQRFGDAFKTRALAESFRSSLLIAQREGIAFDETCGLPEPMARKLRTYSWYQHAVEYVDMKWPHASAGHRKGIAESLTTVTMLCLTNERGAPRDEILRAALYRHAFNTTARASGNPSPETAAALRWLEGNTVDISALLRDAALMRKVLDGLKLRLDGAPAASSTVARKRAVLSNCLRYAVGDYRPNGVTFLHLLDDSVSLTGGPPTRARRRRCPER